MSHEWQEAVVFRARWEANVAALESRNPELASLLRQYRPRSRYLIRSETGGRVQFGRQTDGGIDLLPNPVPLSGARDIAQKLYPAGQCTEPVMVAGLDQGWVWQTVYELPVHTPRTPGHRPPLYLLAGDIERFRLVLHLHDWTKLLADARVRLFVGNDAVEQCRASMIANPCVPWAKLCVTVDPSIWPAGTCVDVIWQQAYNSANARMVQLSRQIEAMYAGSDAKSLARKLRGEQLRVLGITSRYTTFLQHSMRDWLDAMADMGHETHLAIEQTDHELANPLAFAEAVAKFRPDLILMIDHYRAEMTGLPKQIPCVMWVQDQLPNIFDPKAGAAQGPRDYCLGFGRLQLRDTCGYPEQRFMPAQVGTNEKRFAPRQLSRSELDTYGCDLCFVSHASVPATVLLTEQLNRADSPGRKLLIDIFEQMRAVYESDGAVTQPLLIQQMIDSSLRRHPLRLDEISRRSLLDFFSQRINNALFRHQALTWAAELDVNLHLWGRGWDSHPRFARYAKGIACNQSQLATIYQASKINLQITPTGAVHQRLIDGLAAGGFFLLRWLPGDVIERVYRELYEWCRDNRVADDDDLRTRATPHVHALLDQATQLAGVDPFTTAASFMDVLKLCADGQYIRSAGTIWAEYDRVAFRSREELRQLVTHFLAHEAERRAIAESMRRAVLERFTYRRISQRLLDFIADDLASNAYRLGAAA